MSSHVTKNPQLTQEEGKWVLVLERTLKHPKEKVWAALTLADHIPFWGPFKPDRNLDAPGAVRLVHLEMPQADERQGYVLEVNAPNLLVLKWGEDVLRWELNGEKGNTQLVLRHRFDLREDAPSYAAGWHLCLDGLSGTLAGENMPSMVGLNAEKYGWRELYVHYAAQFGLSPL